MMNKPVWACALLCTGVAFAQSNNLTSSPYSLFGVGRFNEVNTGITNSLGRSGIALSGETSINNLNPASVADLAQNSFMFDIGAKADQSSYTNNSNNQVKTTFNFSSVSFATRINSKSGLSVALSPYSNVGYTLVGRANSVEGSTETYQSYIQGSGGLNNLAANYGYRLLPKLSIGLSGNYYFGKIEQTEQIDISGDYLEVTDQNYYSGFRFSTGAQYKVNDKLTLAAVITSPASLHGTKERTVNKQVNDISYSTTNASTTLSAFKLPLEATIGVKYSYKDFIVNADYKRQFWDATGMKDNLGTFSDSNIFGFGVQYTSSKLRPSYLERFQYRIGATTDNGYLEVDGVKIKNSAFTTGLGVPLGSRKSFLNLSYSYGQRGTVSTRLIQERYHAFTVNISLEDLWFVRRKFE